MAMNQECRDVLVTKNLHLMQYNRFTRLLFSSMINEQSYSRLEKDVGAHYGIFGASYGEMQENMKNEFRKTNLNFTQEDAFSAITLYTPDSAIDAWKQCMLANTKGFFSWLEGEPDGLNFHLKLQWEPPVGLGGKKLKIVGFSISDDSPKYGVYMDKLPIKINQGELTIGVRRESNTTNVRGYINAICEGGSFTTAFFIPALYKEEVDPDPWYLSDYPEKLVPESVKNVHGGLTFNRVYWQPDIILCDVKHDKGFGIHPPVNGVAEAAWRIPYGAKWFHAVFGMAKQGTFTVYGSAESRIFIDNVLVKTVRLDGYAQHRISIPIPSTGKVIKFETDSLGTNWGDNTAFGSAHFSNHSTF